MRFWRRTDVAGPGEGQAIDARNSFLVGLINPGVFNTGINGRPSRVARGELFNPQPERPHAANVALAISQASVGVQQAARFPGRLPPSVWDGEPGAGSPTEGSV